MNRFFVVVAAGIAFGAQPVEGEVGWTIAEFLDVCVSSSLRPCASVMVKTQFDENAGPNGETLVEIWVRNEQGPSSLYDNTGGSFITQIGFTAPSIGTVSDFAVTTSGDVGRQGNPNNRWSVDEDALALGAFEATASSNRRGGIRGCGDPAAHAGQYFNTCAGDGYVVFSFTAEGQVNNPQVALQFEGVADPDNPGVSATMVCGAGADCVSPAPVSVTPEPSTWILLATGMVGIFGMGWVRRRREDAA